MHSLAGVSACSRMEADILEMRGDMWRHISAPDEQDMSRQEQEILRLKSDFSRDLKAVSDAAFTDDERELNRKIDPAIQSYYSAWANVATLSRAGNKAEAYKKCLAEALPRYEAALAAVKAETEYNQRNGAIYAAQAAGTYSRVNWTTWLAMLCSAFGGGGLFFWIVRNLNRTLLEDGHPTERRRGSGGQRLLTGRLIQPKPGTGSVRAGRVARADLCFA